MASLKNIHPGEILREEFLLPMELSQHELARRIHVSYSRINGIVQEKGAITPDTALRFAKFFNTTASFWLNLQSYYELEEKSEEMKPVLRDIKTFKIKSSKLFKL